MNTVIGPHWDAQQVGEDLGFDPAAVSELCYINEAWWLHAGETEHGSEVKTVDFESDGDGEESQFLIIPDQGSLIYFQTRAFQATVDGYLLVHAKASEWQMAEELRDFEPDLENWRLRELA